MYDKFLLKLTRRTFKLTGGGNFLEKKNFFFSQIFFGWSLGWVDLVPASSWPQKMLFGARFLRRILENTQKMLIFTPFLTNLAGKSIFSGQLSAETCTKYPKLHPKKFWAKKIFFHFSKKFPPPGQFERPSGYI